jgi:hypothetical protein
VDRAQANSESIAETGQKVESPTLAAKRRPAYKRAFDAQLAFVTVTPQTR